MNAFFRNTTPDHRVGPIKRHDLQYSYFPGAAYGDDPSMRGEPDRSLLNRNQWYEVLYFVNKFANDHGNSDRNVAIKAERLIKTVLPGTLRSHDNVTAFLLQNWNRY